MNSSDPQQSIKASYYRGGTSRGLIFHEDALPTDIEKRHEIFRATLGAPDPNGRQLDGLGGGISSLSKICVVGPSSRPGADVDFTFCQVGVKDGVIDYSSNCGNMTSAIGPFALDQKIVNTAEVVDGADAVVKVFNTNTKKIIHAKFAVQNGQAAVVGDYAMDGVAGTSSPIHLHFINPGGSRTGKLLPTGNLKDEIDGVVVTMIDCANPCVFVEASSMGVDGTLLPAKLQADKSLMSRLESIRRQASVRMGVSETIENAPQAVPKIGLVSPPSRHQILSGDIVEASSADLVVRIVSMGQFHLASPITIACALTVAARVEGTTVSDCVSSETRETVRIGHPSGRIEVGSTFSSTGEVESAVLIRTARKLMEGQVFWK